MSSTDWEEGREGDAERVDADELAKVPPGSAEEVGDEEAVVGDGGVGRDDWTTRPAPEGGDLTGEAAGSGWTAGGGTLGAEGTGSAPGTDDVTGEPGASRRRDDDEEVVR